MSACALGTCCSAHGADTTDDAVVQGKRMRPARLLRLLSIHVTPTTEDRGRCDSTVTWKPMTAGVAARVVNESTFRNTRSQTRLRAAAIVVCDPLVENRAKVPLV